MSFELLGSETWLLSIGQGDYSEKFLTSGFGVRGTDIAALMRAWGVCRVRLVDWWRSPQGFKPGAVFAVLSFGSSGICSLAGPYFKDIPKPAVKGS